MRNWIDAAAASSPNFIYLFSLARYGSWTLPLNTSSSSSLAVCNTLEIWMKVLHTLGDNFTAGRIFKFNTYPSSLVSRHLHVVDSDQDLGHHHQDEYVLAVDNYQSTEKFFILFVFNLLLVCLLCQCSKLQTQTQLTRLSQRDWRWRWFNLSS